MRIVAALIATLALTLGLTVSASASDVQATPTVVCSNC